MCKIGDIILIYNARNRRPVGPHPFIVLDDNAGIVSGIYSYDFIGLLMISADTPEKKERIGNIRGNFPISADDKNYSPERSDNRYAYAETNQFFYFNKEKIRYLHIGTLDPDIYNLIIEYIEELSEHGITIRQILDKAKKISETIQEE